MGDPILSNASPIQEGAAQESRGRGFQLRGVEARYVASLLADTHKFSAKTIQRILRHKNLATTERYIHNINRDLTGTMNLLGEKGPHNNSKGLGNEP